MVLINEIKRTHALRRSQRVGRGGKRGTYSGRGQKGQRARAGRNIKSQARESLLKIPQQRGTGSKLRAFSAKRKPLSLNLQDFRKEKQSAPKLWCSAELLSAQPAKFRQSKFWDKAS